MSKHPLDHDRGASTARALAYTRPERREGLHPATRALHQRPRGASTRRVENFARTLREKA